MTEMKRRPDTEQLDLWDPNQRRLQRVAVSTHGMVASAHHHASEAGAQILEQGGTAVDAAVAAALALGVCEPAASGLGGQTMMLVFDAESRRKVALDGSSRAPNRALPNSLPPEQRRRGYCAATVPSTLAVLDYALRTFGSKTFAEVAEPAITLAENGFRISALQRALTRRERKYIKQGTAAPLFLVNNKSPQVNHLFRQPQLASTIRRLARVGVEDFYTGGIARKIHRDMVRNGGLIRSDDLAQIPWPIERRPVSGRFGPLRFFTMPPPGAGRTLIEMFNILSHFPPRRYNLDKSRGAVLIAEVIRRAIMDRRDRPFDPDFYAQTDERRMLDMDYARKVASSARKRIRTAGETTHVSVMDRFGNAVSLTQSIENVFGACVANPDLGFLYNNYMNAFDYEDISHPYHMRPNAVPWASVAPTIVFRGPRPWLVIGSPGSERIAPSILQVILRRLAGLSLYEAVSAPRLHCSLGGKVSLEAARMPDTIPRRLESAGFDVDVRDPFSFYLGCVQAVEREGKLLYGVADPRRDGSAAAPQR
jgi:gamma-glutamyltranspeptidase/glutathione hydrolase